MSAANVRQRTGKQKTTENTSGRVPTEVEDAGRVISVLDIVRVLLTLVAISCGLSYYLTSGESVLYGYRPWFTKPAKVSQYLKGTINLTPAELTAFDGTDVNKPIYIAVNGTIFDVSEGRHTYGPGGSYSVFAGRDATRAFVTGCFADDTTSDLRGAEEVFLPIEDPDEQISSGGKKKRAEQERREAKKRVIQEVQKWQAFYKNSKKYFEVGKVVGVEKPTGPPPKLCDSAQSGRPKRKNMNEGKADRAAPGKPVI